MWVALAVAGVAGDGAAAVALLLLAFGLVGGQRLLTLWMTGAVPEAFPEASLAALKRAGVFPPLLVYLAASGESAGRLDTMLERAADYLEREFDRFTAASMALLEPVIIVVMGSCVALIILAILLPILQLQNLAGL